MKKIIALILVCALGGAGWIYWQYHGLEARDEEEEIITKYQRKSAAIEVEFENKVNIMIDEAKAEYLALSPEKRNKEKYNLAFKYMAKAAELEKECDKRFETILEDMKKELKSHRLSTSSVKVARQQYKEEKSARRKALMAKVMNQNNP